MFNKEGLPFFIIIIPFFSLIFLSFFSVSYYMKVSEKSLIQTQNILYQPTLSLEEKQKALLQEKISEKEEFTHFLITATLTILLFMVLFSFLMTNIVNDIIKKYKQKVRDKELSLKELNRTLATKVAKGIAEGKEKDKAILRESRLARLGSMLSMIAHQWRQPLSELSGLLMELEMATKFKRLSDDKLLSSIGRSNDVIEYMSNTIDDFRNFYKPDKTKTLFSLSDACYKAFNLADAALKNAAITPKVDIRQENDFFGYPSEFSQAILNLLSNAKDVLVERAIKNPFIALTIDANPTHSIIIIQDNGGGIDEQSMEHIFDPYYSTKDATKGTGLGLYIAKTIIEQNMGGKMHVANDADGAVFTLLFERQTHA